MLLIRWSGGRSNNRKFSNMKGAAHRVIFNTVILYLKIVITMLISLVTVPMVLRALGESDYGLYNLIAGVISMLSFLNASMTIATQRYLSVAIGESNNYKLNEIYNSSIILHLIIGVVIVVIFEFAAIFIFDGFLNIDPDRIQTAKAVYQFLVLSTFFTILSVPYNAVMNAKEDMLAFSIIGIFDSIVRLVIAYFILHSGGDRLMLYSLLIASLTILITLINRVYVKYRYREFRFLPKEYVTVGRLIEMFGFAGWNTLGAVAMIGRNQGIAILFNIFVGTIANAAYGIANQINGVLSYFSSTFQKALNPQLMQSHGMNDRERLIRISCWSSKYSVLVLALFAVPIIIEMPYILKIWLHEIPQYTIRFCQLILVLSIVYQYSTGLMSAIQAVGKIRVYFIVMSILIIMNLPISYLILKTGFPVYFCLIIFIIIEIISFIVRLYMSSVLVKLPVARFLKTVLLPTIIVISISTMLAGMVHVYLSESFVRLLLVCIVYFISYSVCSWMWCIDKSHRVHLKSLVCKILKCK